MNGTTVTDFFPQLSPAQVQQFAALPELYARWNAQINVISRKDMDNFFTHHLLHSLSIARFIRFNAGTQVLDIGTGGGFPGIPLAIFFPEVQFHLVDSIGKKIKVVNEVAAELGLQNVKAQQTRAEELKTEYDFVVSRAVAPWPDIHRWSAKLISRKGRNALPNGWLLLKGGDLKEELASAAKRLDEFALSDWFSDPFFETKKLIYIPA
ncbi:MAG: 16S rRNA (guanine(527)-N(7))-methyltransferase RsmG [Bacteroidetes bacterium]|nr:16S rRNA (guanine(527)-N(7))-methyltransferase RsmG [Bacteroidota bacterium]